MRGEKALVCLITSVSIFHTRTHREKPSTPASVLGFIDSTNHPTKEGGA
jgi:hypothetical protein